jgi:HEAT repeat protein
MKAKRLFSVFRNLVRRGPAPLLVACAVGLAGCGGDVTGRVTSIYELKADPTEENVAKIRKLLADPDGDVRATALNALVTIDVDDAEQLALAGLEDEDPFVRATAAKLVGDVGVAANAARLADRLRNDGNPIVRQRAAEALEVLGGEVAVVGLAEGMDDPMQNVRLASVRGIRRLDPGFAPRTLERLLTSDPSWEIRVQAATALGASGDPLATPVLQAALEDRNEFVRSAAANALREIPEVESEPEAETDAAAPSEGSS